MGLFRNRKPPVKPTAPRSNAATRLAPGSTPSAPLVEPRFLELFDSKWYLDVNGDVAAAGVDALAHFIAHGEAEGRDPNPTFSTRLYRETYMEGEPHVRLGIRCALRG
jgi:hypothetical protein